MSLFSRFKKNEELKPYSIDTVVKGNVIDIKETSDPSFSTESLGKGVGITAEDDILTAPIGGVISMLFPTMHAIGITTDQGIEILIHVGVDTVELNGKYFAASVKQGDKVKRGDTLLKVDFDEIKKAGYDATVLMVIANSADFKDIKTKSGYKGLGESVIEIEV